uniref:Uncharacterized protein n=1 Tax=Nothobranchius furzeri TaxID=105023 RepID=A0A8C6LDR8_NOTFU
MAAVIVGRARKAVLVENCFTTLTHRRKGIKGKRLHQHVYGHGFISLILYLNRQIKGLCRCQANMPQPTGYGADDRKTNQKERQEPPRGLRLHQ